MHQNNGDYFKEVQKYECHQKFDRTIISVSFTSLYVSICLWRSLMCYVPVVFVKLELLFGSESHII
jgi:hypothetical protein